MRRAVCPGSFDPPTHGHVDIISRASRLFDEVTVAVLVNPDKKGLFTVDERITMLSHVAGQFDNVKVDSFEGLLVDFCREHDIHAIVKGIRAVSDFDYELQMAQMNTRLTGVETVFVPTSPEWSFLASSLVKQVAGFGGDVSGLVPSYVLDRLNERLRSNDPHVRPDVGVDRPGEHGYEAADGDEGKEATSVDVRQLIAQLRSMVENARSMPMSSSAVVNRGEMLDLIAQLEQAVPTAFEHSERVYAERDALLAEAQARADRIVEEAGLERDRMVSDTDVHRIALRLADEMRATAEQECSALRSETDEYVDTRLANFEITLTKTLEAVSRGRDRLQGRHQLDQGSLDALAELDDSTIPPLPQH